MNIPIKSKTGLRYVYNRKILSAVALIFMIALTFSCLLSEFKGVSPFALGTLDKIVSNETELRDAINNAPTKNSYTIAFNNDITLTDSSLSIPANKDITLTSNNKKEVYKLIDAEAGSTITDDRTIVVESGGVLRLDGIIVTMFSSAGVTVRENGLLVLYSGEISGNTAHTNMFGAGMFSSVGGGVYNDGTFEMYSGKISNNHAYFFASMSTGSGGGVFNRGVF